MKNGTLLLSLSLIAAAMAGCATDDGSDGGGTTTTPTSTTATPGTTTTPTTTPTSETPGPMDCPEPPTTDDEPGERMGYPEVTFTVQEPAGEGECFAFVGPESVSAGWTAVTLQNTGRAPHIMPMYRLTDGHTLEDFLAAAGAGEEPEWAQPAGGVGFVTPFQSGTVLMDLQEGTYVVICFFDGHHMQGMYRALNVTAAEGEPREAPQANFTVELRNFEFDVPENLTAGTHVVRFTNAGTQPHEAPLVKLDEGVTMEEFLHAVEDPTRQAPPPGAGVGGVNVLAPGAEAYAIVELTEGDYGFVCFVSSPEHDGAPHVALGMVAQFSVGGSGNQTA